MSHFEDLLTKYAKVAITKGINLQKGQKLIINSPITSAKFVHKIAEAAYDAGAADVMMDWNDEAFTRIRFEKAPDDAFTTYPEWKAKGFEKLAEENAAFLYIMAPNPHLLEGIDANRISTWNKTTSTTLETFNHYRQAAIVSWTIISAPSKEWAEKIFPELKDEAAIEALWEQIFNISRVTSRDPVQAWEDHIQNLTDKLTKLNDMKLKSLHYQSEGTDLTVNLVKDHIWVGGTMTNGNGHKFVPNMPTEEVFTMPDKDGVNGTVKSTLPLNYAGNLIENFSFTFENGRITDFSAEKGYDTLKNLVETDEGSHRLGEVALVPHHSPISDTGLIFFNTLFDENASCHMAIGAAYPFNITDGTTQSKDQLAERGANKSLTHVDFMIGSKDLNIDGETHDGKKVAIFREGNWAF